MTRVVKSGQPLAVGILLVLVTEALVASVSMSTFRSPHILYDFWRATDPGSLLFKDPPSRLGELQNPESEPVLFQVPNGEVFGTLEVSPRVSLSSKVLRVMPAGSQLAMCRVSV